LLQLFFQEYFICDWWFNVDCSRSENLYSLNEDIAAGRSNLESSASNEKPTYAAPLSTYGSRNGLDDVITQAKVVASKLPATPPQLPAARKPQSGVNFTKILRAAFFI